MPLTMRPTSLGAGIDKDRPDYTVYCGGWAIGRIYDGSSALVLVFHRHKPDGTLRSQTTLEEAKAQFQKSWDAWKAWAGLKETD